MSLTLVYTGLMAKSNMIDKNNFYRLYRYRRMVLIELGVSMYIERLIKQNTSDVR